MDLDQIGNAHRQDVALNGGYPAVSGRGYPLGRIAEPDDLIPALLFLCGQGGAYMTGQVIHVNGGSFMP